LINNKAACEAFIALPFGYDLKNLNKILGGQWRMRKSLRKVPVGERELRKARKLRLEGRRSKMSEKRLYKLWYEPFLSRY